jgi:GNAT superfamily N-acetyltransferase
VALHPLGKLLLDASDGRFPAPDGGWHRVPPWRDDVEAAVAFTAHAVFALRDDVDDATLTKLGADGYGGAHHPRLVAELAGPDGWIDSIDAVLLGRGTGQPSPLVERQDLAGSVRALHAYGVRDVRHVLGYPDRDDSSVVVVSDGLGGVTELSFELDPRFRGGGRARGLVDDALAVLPTDKVVVTAVAPGNAASLRTVLGAGFVPVASVQLWRREA